MLAVAAHLANSPSGGVLICLVVALVLFVISAVVAGLVRAFYATLMAAALAFFTLAFLVS